MMPVLGERLEEFDYDDNEGVWLLTLSFDEQLSSALIPERRNYKTFAVDALSGEVMSMKTRNLLLPSESSKPKKDD